MQIICKQQRPWSLLCCSKSSREQFVVAEDGRALATFRQHWYDSPGEHIKMPEKLTSVIAKFYDEYIQSTPKRLKIVDAYLVYVFLTGVFQFGYCCLVGTFPFNSFLSGFISTVGSFVLGGKHSLHSFAVSCHGYYPDMSGNDAVCLSLSQLLNVSYQLAMTRPISYCQPHFGDISYVASWQAVCRHMYDKFPLWLTLCQFHG